MPQPESSSYHFKAEIRQLLDILVHSLYKEREIFLRELISNASDALTRIHFEMLTNQDVLDPEVELAIHIEVKEEDGVKQLLVKDSGIGMTPDELVTNLGTIAQSGAREFLDRIESDEVTASDIIGQFGVGFYSVFMVADEVRVVSRSYKTDSEAAAWFSKGGEDFHVEPAQKSDRGTEIQITLKGDADEFTNEWTLKQLVKKYSDFVAYPIYVGEEQANQQESLWRRSPSAITGEDYKQFYQQLTMDFEEQLATVHLSSDAPIHMRAILFVPAKREKSILSLRKEPGIKLYSHNVLIQEYCLDLLPKWLDFVDGVVDSEDLPLNVSRETIQNTRMMQRLGKTLRRRVLRELSEMAEEEIDNYNRFWEQFGRVLKEGLASDPTIKDEILPYFRFHSSGSGDGLISLDEYIDRMPDSQKEIYYVLADDTKSAAYSPHLDPFKTRDLEVLYLVDPLDPFITPLLDKYKEIQLRNVDDLNLELPETDAEIDEEPGDAGPSDADFNLFIGKCVSPIRLVAPDDGPGHDMQRVYKYLDQEYTVPKKIMEVNRRHHLIVDLVSLLRERPLDPLVELSIEQLYESALVMEGLHPNPTAMLPRVQQLLELAAERSVVHDEEE
jgi:molecular chaperone HtpG